ncbi:uncharacterized protein LOC143628641 [Bidens hawaiensis]|uniref:uncharacterized protein LOC143628641 n=1 Tax=Bidens hawaiensis TaxID=980011 RepID=UPI00404A8685
MARLLTQTLTLTRATPSNPLQIIFKLGNRFSSRSGKYQLTQIDLDSDADVEVLGIRKLEDAIHNIIVRQSAPDWLPFVPGSSYWVPPRAHRPESHDLFQALKRFTNPLTEDESMAVTSSRGWPSSAYFIQDSPPVHPVEVKDDINLDDEG